MKTHFERRDVVCPLVGGSMSKVRARKARHFGSIVCGTKWMPPVVGSLP